VTPRREGRIRTPRLSAELRERETVKPLELFFDLVFVLGFTQCTALMAAQPTWSGIGRGMLALAVIWWAWVCYAWLTSVVEPEEGSVRLVMLAAMAGLLVVALCVLQAFGDRALGFAVASGAVRLGHIALYLIASRDSPGLRRWVLTFAISTVMVTGLLVGASFVGGGVQAAFWMVAILLEWVGAAIFGVTEWRLVPGHFASRLSHAPNQHATPPGRPLPQELGADDGIRTMHSARVDGQIEGQTRTSVPSGWRFEPNQRVARLGAWGSESQRNCHAQERCRNGCGILARARVLVVEKGVQLGL
jgi:hypothetical protein